MRIHAHALMVTETLRGGYQRVTSSPPFCAEMTELGVHLRGFPFASTTLTHNLDDSLSEHKRRVLSSLSFFFFSSQPTHNNNTLTPLTHTLLISFNSHRWECSRLVSTSPNLLLPPTLLRCYLAPLLSLPLFPSTIATTAT